MKIIISALIMLFTTISYAETIKVAVIDTGLDITKAKNLKLCNEGHKDFTGQGIMDTHGHGTNVAGIISEGNQNIDYCMIIIKYYNPESGNNIDRFVASLLHVSKLDVDIVNISTSGTGKNNIERDIIRGLLDNGTIVNAAAGNSNKNLNKDCDHFPACYDKRIFVIGNKGNRSNYGSKVVDYVIDGNNKESLGKTLSGTSQSTAIFTSRSIKMLNKVRRNK